MEFALRPGMFYTTIILGALLNPFFNIGYYLVPILPYCSIQTVIIFPILVLLASQLPCHVYNKYFEGVQLSHSLLNVVDYIWITVPKDSFHPARPSGLHTSSSRAQRLCQTMGYLWVTTSSGWSLRLWIEGILGAGLWSPKMLLFGSLFKQLFHSWSWVRFFFLQAQH